MMELDLGHLYREGLAMSGLEGIIQELKEKREAQLQVYREIGAYIEGLDFMIAAGEQQLNGGVDQERSLPVPDTRISMEETTSRANPFKMGTIKYHCFDVLSREGQALYVETIWGKVRQYRRCSLGSVSHELYANTAVFKKGDAGFFTLANT